MLSGELGVSKAFLASSYIGGGYMDVSEVVIFMIVAKYTSRTNIPSLSCGESVSPCEVPFPNCLQHNVDDAPKDKQKYFSF